MIFTIEPEYIKLNKTLPSKYIMMVHEMFDSAIVFNGVHIETVLEEDGKRAFALVETILREIALNLNIPFIIVDVEYEYMDNDNDGALMSTSVDWVIEQLGGAPCT